MYALRLNIGIGLIMNASPDTVKNMTIGASEMRQSFAGGVQRRQWFVAVVRSNYEALCRDCLQKMGYEAYVASQKEVHRYRNRHRREVEKVVISRVVFVRIANEKERLAVLKDCSFIQYFMMDRAATPNEMGRAPFAVIPDYQIEALQYMLFHAEDSVDFVTTPLLVGDKVRVIRGALQGVEGEVVVVKEGNTQSVGIQVGFLGFATINIDPDDIEKV